MFLLECRRDEDGYYWIVGRVDDCMNVSGHLLSTAEIESALVEHGAVSEAAVVSKCFFTKKNDVLASNWIKLYVILGVQLLGC